MPFAITFFSFFIVKSPVGRYEPVSGGSLKTVEHIKIGASLLANINSSSVYLTPAKGPYRPGARQSEAVPRQSISFEANGRENGEQRQPHSQQVTVERETNPFGEASPPRASISAKPARSNPFVSDRETTQASSSSNPFGPVEPKTGSSNPFGDETPRVSKQLHSGNIGSSNPFDHYGPSTGRQQCTSAKNQASSLNPFASTTTNPFINGAGQGFINQGMIEQEEVYTDSDANDSDYDPRSNNPFSADLP